MAPMASTMLKLAAGVMIALLAPLPPSSATRPLLYRPGPSPFAWVRAQYKHKTWPNMAKLLFQSRFSSRISVFWFRTWCPRAHSARLRTCFGRGMKMRLIRMETNMACAGRWFLQALCTGVPLARHPCAIPTVILIGNGLKTCIRTQVLFKDQRVLVSHLVPAGTLCASQVFFFFFFITLKPRVE